MRVRGRFMVILRHLGRRSAFVALRVTAIALLVIFAAPARAQFIGFTSPQSVQQILANSVVCTGVAQTFNVTNLGQTQHYAYIQSNAGITNLSAVIEALDSSGNAYPISDQAFSPAGIQPLTITASGYFPIVRVSVTCAGGSFTLNYSGISATANYNAGAFALAQSSKTIFANQSFTANHTTRLQPPFLSTAGKIIYGGNAPAGSTFVISCGGLALQPPNAALVSYTFPLATTGADQTFIVPPTSCPNMTFAYVTGGGGAGTGLIVDYIFTQPSFVNIGDAIYAHIASTTATSVKDVGGILTQITIGTAAAGTVTLHDLVAASCVMTPATNIVSVLTVAAAAAPSTLPLNLTFINGICVKASATMDITVGFQ